MLQVESSLNHRADAKPQVWSSHYSSLFQSDARITCAMGLTLSDSVNDIPVWVPCSSQTLHYLHCIIPGLYSNCVISPGIAAVFHIQSVLNSEFHSPLTLLDHSRLSAEREFASVLIADLWQLSEEGLHEIHCELALFLEVPAEMLFLLWSQSWIAQTSYCSVSSTVVGF